MRELKAPCLFVCPGCGERVRSYRSAEVEHRCPGRHGKLVRFRLTVEPDRCKVET